MVKMMSVSFRLPAEIREDTATQCFEGYCPALGLYSAGRYTADASEALKSAVDMYGDYTRN